MRAMRKRYFARSRPMRAPHDRFWARRATTHRIGLGRSRSPSGALWHRVPAGRSRSGDTLATGHFTAPEISMDRLTGVPELLDGPLDDPDVLIGNLRDLRRVNPWLGGIAPSKTAVDALVG